LIEESNVVHHEEIGNEKILKQKLDDKQNQVKNLILVE